MPRSRVLLIPLWLAASVCGCVPFLVALHTFPLATFYSEFTAGICWIALAVGVLVLTWDSQAKLPKIALAPLALVGVLVFQLRVATPLNPYLSFAAIVFLLAAALACGLGVRCRSLPSVLEALATGLLLGGVLTVAIELLHLFRVPGLPPEFFAMTPTGNARRMWGNLNQPNHAASYLAFSLAACGYLAHRCRRAWFALGVIALVLLLGMSLTFSRITWLHIALVGGLAGLVCTSDQRGWHRWAQACVPVVLLAVAYQLCNWLVAYLNILWHLDLSTSLGDRMQQGAGLRWLLWKHAWHMFLAHPWLGGGWGDYAWNQYVQTDVLGRVEMSMNAHNIVLDILAKVGVVGLLAVMLPLLGLIWSLRKRQLTPAVAFLYAISLVMLAHSMLEYPLHYLFFLLLFAFALGYLDEKDLRAPSARMTWALTAAYAVCGVALLMPLWGDYKALERLNYGPEDFRKELARYQSHGSSLLTPYENLAMANRWTVIPATASTVARLERQAVEFYPGPSTVQRYAIALAYLGKTDEAVLQIRRMHNHYWSDYAEQSGLLTYICRRKTDSLKAFCTRLILDNLLVETSPAGQEKSMPASQ